MVGVASPAANYGGRVPIDLTLGIPRPHGPESLLSGLVSERFSQARAVTSADDVAVAGAPIVAASGLLGQQDVDLGRIVVCLDVDPLELRSAPQGGYEAVRYELDCPVRDLGEAIALRIPSPLAVYPELDEDSELTLADAARELADAGKIPGLGRGHLSLSGTRGSVADFLAVLAHADVGFVARVDNAAQVLELLAGTIAALRGDDVRAALAEPDPARLTTLVPDAVAAVREVLLGIEVPNPREIGNRLADWGLA